MNALQRVGYLVERGPAALSAEGWKLAEELTRETSQSDQAFVAMWFHDDLRDAYVSGYEPALRACGYNPYRVDLAPHNNKIDDEIVANIRKSALLVADLTGCRPNVFYEAGLAYGLGKHVLYTCHQTHVGHFLRCAPSGPMPAGESASWFDQVSDHAFDVRQFLVMGWTTPTDLAKALEGRIRSLGLDLPVPRA
jgi:nucleoside 2-deoxyribosyltransferase